jgi:hypothetical protein
MQPRWFYVPLQILAFICLSVAQQPASFPLFNSPANVKARQIINEAITALGGPAYLKARYKSGSGRSYSFNSAGELDNAGTLFWSFSRFPDADRAELTKERDVVYLFNGDEGWQITFRGVTPMKPEQVRDHSDARDHSIDMILRRWINDPQALMIYRGLEMVDQLQVDVVDITNGKGETVNVAFDLNSHLPVSVTWRRQDPDLNIPLTERVTFGNYQMIDGVNTAMDVQRFEGTQRLSQRYYESISYQPLPDSLFQRGPLQKPAKSKHR